LRRQESERRPFSLSADEYFFFFNAPAGRYVAVATYSTGLTSSIRGFEPPVILTTTSWSHSTYFPTALIEKTAVEVHASSLMFLGRIELESEAMEEPDAAQSHYRSILASSSSVESRYFDRELSPVLWEVDRSAEAWERFIADAEAPLSRSGWASVLKGHGLGSRRPPD
jgi:hypothetical protein